MELETAVVKGRDFLKFSLKVFWNARGEFPTQNPELFTLNDSVNASSS